MSEGITVRRQKRKSSHTKWKLWFFLTLVILLMVIRGIGLDSLLSKSQYRASEIMYPITANNTTAYPAEQSALHTSWHLRRRSIAAEYRTFGFLR